MKIQKKKLNGFFEIISEPYIDHRGFMVHLYDEKIFKSFGLNTKWVQEGWSHTEKKYTIRGLSASRSPFLEGKIVTAIKGEMLWVVVDLRKNSETFGHWESIVLSGNKNTSIYVKRGFANGCMSLSDNCDLVFLSWNYFSEEHQIGIIWNDPELNIDWNLKDISPIMSEGHRNYATFKEFKEKYGGLDVE